MRLRRQRLWRVALVVLAALALLALLFWNALRPPAGPEPRARVFTLDDVTLVTPGRERLAGRALGVRDGRIAARGEAWWWARPSRSTPAPSCCRA